MKKHTLGQHYDAWSRFIQWYWKYTIKPRFTNIPRRIRYHLRKNPKKRWDDKNIRGVFYSEGQILETTKVLHGYAGPSFKAWWKEHMASDRMPEIEAKKKALHKHVKDMRKIVKSIKDKKPDL